MNKFETFTESVEIETPTGKDKFVLKALGTNDIGKYFHVLRQLASVKEDMEVGENDTQEFGVKLLNKLDEETYKNLHDLITKSLLKTYKEDREKVEEFVTQNMFNLLGTFLKVQQRQTDVGRLKQKKEEALKS